MSRYLELLHEKVELKSKLTKVEQEMCGLLPGHSFKTYISWSGFGKRCKYCKLILIEVPSKVIKSP